MAETATTERPVFDSVDELLGGAEHLGNFRPADARSGASFERVVVDGERCVVKYVHVDDDFALRSLGDIGCIPLRVWESGLMDSAPERIDHATIGASRWGRNDWGAALLMRDVTDELVPVSDEPIDEESHLAFLSDLAELSARRWEWIDDVGLLPPASRWRFFSPEALGSEGDLGFPEPVPRIALEGWERFATVAPQSVVEGVTAILADMSVFGTALADTPSTLLHGDWKLGNLGRGRDGRTVLIDWAYVGSGPVAHELAWYLALNRARLPQGHTKESTIAEFARVLTSALSVRGFEVDSWWDRQLDLCLLGALVQFGWEKALGPADELGWWCDRAVEGLERL